MQKPKILLEMQCFVGAVNHYHYIWPKELASLLPCPASLARKPSIGPQKWTLPWNIWRNLWHMTAFFAYSNINKPFQIYNHASSHHMQDWIVQDNKSMAFWSHNLNKCTTQTHGGRQRTPLPCHGSYGISNHASRCWAAHPHQHSKKFGLQFHTFFWTK